MRTTLDLDDALMREAKQRAAATGRTLTGLVEAALRELLRRESRTGDYELDWRPVAGAAQAGVDLDDRDALWTRMEERG
jgi:plasmid stability protein